MDEADPGRADDPRLPRRHGRRRWLKVALAAAGGLALVAIVALVVLLGSSGSPGPGSFYALPSPLPVGPPGAVIRSEALADPPTGAKAWKILYLSRSYAGGPTAVSGLPVRAHDGCAGGRAQRRGVQSRDNGCGFQLRTVEHRPVVLAAIDGLTRILQAGDVVVAPDYQGLGTPGPHPYLVGDAEATATLDEVRAARRLPPRTRAPGSSSGAPRRAGKPRCSPASRLRRTLRS